MNELLRTAALHWLKLNAMSTVYAAVGLTTGALTSLIVPAFLDVSVWTAFAVGFFLPMGPLYLYAASDRSMTRKLTQVKRWRDDELITDEHYETLRTQIIDWYSSRVCPGQGGEALGSVSTTDQPGDDTGEQACSLMNGAVASEGGSTVLNKR